MDANDKELFFVMTIGGMSERITQLEKQSAEYKRRWHNSRRACRQQGKGLQLQARVMQLQAAETILMRQQRDERADEVRKLRAQLAAEQDNARQSREEIEALKGDVAAMAENQGEWMRRAMAVQDQLAAAQAEARELREALEMFRGQFDYNGCTGTAEDALAKHKEAQP